MVSLLILCFSAFPLRTLETVVIENPVRAAIDESVSFIELYYCGYSKVKNINNNSEFHAIVFAKISKIVHLSHILNVAPTGVGRCVSVTFAQKIVTKKTGCSLEETGKMKYHELLMRNLR